jgi:molybdopterin-guanine dinucleotide biosynthesis protein A
MEAVTAFVLAGGKSSRMGRDKALLQFGGKTLLEGALVLASTVAPKLKIVGDPAKYAEFAPVVSDIYLDRGPLGGIHAALINTDTDLNLILATDLPFVAPAFLQHLIATARSTDALVTVPKLGHFFEPLCAIYRKEFSNVAQQALIEGRNKVDALFTAGITYLVSEEEIVAAGFSPAMFRNLNTPEDFASL